MLSDLALALIPITLEGLSIGFAFLSMWNFEKWSRSCKTIEAPRFLNRAIWHALAAIWWVLMLIAYLLI
jgi:hypothetical protein